MFTYVSVALMGLLLILHFMPYWSYEGISTSIQTYIWSPSDHAQLETYLASQIGGEFSINNILLMPILVLVMTVAGIILCLWKWETPLMSLIPLFCGLVGVWGYLFKPAFQLGSNWVLHLVVCIGMIASSALTLVFASKNE